MAEDKKSFLLYADLIHTVRKMPKEKAGELLLTILSYVNDEDPIVDDIVVELVFEPIKQQMKRDLRKYEGKKQQWSDAGKASAEARRLKKESEVKNDETNLTDVEIRSTDSTVTVNDTVTVIKEREKGDESPLPPKSKKKKVEKKEFIPPAFEEFEKYCDENGFKGIAQRAFRGYSDAEPPWHDSQGNKILSWKQKLQNVWFKENNKDGINKKNSGSKTIENSEYGNW